MLGYFYLVMEDNKEDNTSQDNAGSQESENQQPAQFFVKKKSEETRHHKPSWKEKARHFFVECRRVLKVTKKPSTEEFKSIVKVTGVGILIIGLIGFLIHFLKEIVF